MRDDKIDVLRFIGLAMVILAHVGTPGILFQARNFDVPLMVIVSGLSFTASQKQERYRDYLTKRLTRLVLPVWLFLTAYFLANEIFNLPLKTLSAEDILSSYALQSGIGYVWIIRVFALVAIAAPFIYKLSRHQANTRHLYTLLVILAVHEVLCFVRRKFVPDFLVSFVDDYLLYLVPYSVIFSFGTRLKSLTQNPYNMYACSADWLS